MYPEALGILGDLFVVDKQLITKHPWEELEPPPICAHTFEILFRLLRNFLLLTFFPLLASNCKTSSEEFLFYSEYEQEAEKKSILVALLLPQP